MICIEITKTGQRVRIEREIWVSANRNGLYIAPNRILAKGVGDGEQIWSLGALDGYPGARIITLAEYMEGAPETDPELTAEQALEIILGGSYESK